MENLRQPADIGGDVGTIKRRLDAGHPAIAATGKPLAIALAKVVRSATTPSNCYAPPAEARNPVMPSSKI
jgi:hypothetical protein